MTRKTIELPTKFNFSTQYSVLYSDINTGKHLGSDKVLPIALEAQMRYISHLGYDNAISFEDAGLIMAHSEVTYLSEASYSDQLQVDLAVVNFTKNSFEFVYGMTNIGLGLETARVRTTMLFFDYETKKVIPVPESFKNKVSDAQRP